MSYSATGAILDNKKILLIKRSQNSKLFPNCWDLPGGKGSKGETPEQTVIREVKEETNLDFKPIKNLITTKYFHRDIYTFIGTWDGKIYLQKEEISDHGWFRYEDTLTLTLAFSDKEVLEELRKNGYI